MSCTDDRHRNVIERLDRNEYRLNKHSERLDKLEDFKTLLDSEKVEIRRNFESAKEVIDKHSCKITELEKTTIELSHIIKESNKKLDRLTNSIWGALVMIASYVLYRILNGGL